MSMRFDEAMMLAAAGELVTRPGYGEHFVGIRDGRPLYGGFIGETGLAEMRAHAFTDEERRAGDWKRFARTLPDVWEGCDAPDGM